MDRGKEPKRYWLLGPRLRCGLQTEGEAGPGGRGRHLGSQVAQRLWALSWKRKNNKEGRQPT